MNFKFLQSKKRVPTQHGDTNQNATDTYQNGNVENVTPTNLVQVNVDTTNSDMEVEAIVSPSSDGESTNTLTMKGNTQYKSVKFDAQEEIYVRLNLTAGENPVMNEKRKPLDITVVLDVSGSMSGEKLLNCIETCNFLVHELNELDRLCLIKFGSEVETVFPLQYMSKKNKQNAERIIDQLSTNGATNLSGGLFEGIQVMQGSLKSSDTDVKAIMLLTDGHMNRGIADAKHLVDAVRLSMNAMPSVNLFSFGYGTNHNVELLKSLSECGNGQYYFVENADNVSEAFGDCLGGLLSVAAQNISLECKPIGGASITGNPFTSFKYTKKGNGFEIKIPDIYENESKDVLFKVKLPSLSTPVLQDDAPLLQVDVQYLDVFKGNISNDALTICIVRGNETSEEADNAVIEQVNRVEMVQAMENASKLADNGKYNQAQTLMDGFMKVMKSRSKSTEYNVKLESEVESAKRRMDASWLQKGTYMQRNLMAEHTNQRSASSSMDSMGMYATKQKVARMNKAKKSVQARREMKLKPVQEQTTISNSGVFGNTLNRVSSMFRSAPSNQANDQVVDANDVGIRKSLSNNPLHTPNVEQQVSQSK